MQRRESDMRTVRSATRKSRSGRLSGTRQLGEITSLSDVCHNFGIPGVLCSCDTAATAVAVSPLETCEWKPFAAACPKKYAQMCREDPPQMPPGGRGPHRAGSDLMKYAAIAVAGGSLLAVAMNSGRD